MPPDSLARIQAKAPPGELPLAVTAGIAAAAGGVARWGVAAPAKVLVASGGGGGGAVAGLTAGGGAVVGLTAGGAVGGGVTAVGFARTGKSIRVMGGSPSPPVARIREIPPDTEWRREVPVAEFLADNDKLALGATKAAQMPPTVTAE